MTERSLCWVTGFDPELLSSPLYSPALKRTFFSKQTDCPWAKVFLTSLPWHLPLPLPELPCLLCHLTNGKTILFPWSPKE